MSVGGVKRLWDKYRYAALAVILGVGLMLWPSPGRDAGKNRETAASRDLQKEMEEVLGKIRGVGQVRVLLTEESDGERILAEDIALSYRDGAEGNYSRNSETVLVDAGNGDEAVVVQTRYPAYRGALVVCEGGDSPAVRLAVTRAVSALTGLSSSRVAVEKWQ